MLRRSSRERQENRSLGNLAFWGGVGEVIKLGFPEEMTLGGWEEGEGLLNLGRGNVKAYKKAARREGTRGVYATERQTVCWRAGAMERVTG